MAQDVVVRGTVQLEGQIRGSVKLESYIKGHVLPVVPLYPPEYRGPTTITPSPEHQTLETAELMVAENITIEPIPSNYGLITWDGSIITVS